MIIGIYGAGGGGREFFELIIDINEIEKKWDEIVFIDDFSNLKELRGCPVYTFDELTAIYSPNEIEITLAVGQPKDRKNLFEKVTSRGYKMATLIHPTAKVLLGTKISPGCVIEHYAVISCDSIIDENVLVLPFVTMGNNCEIGKHSVISTHSSICASVIIGDGTYFGVNCCVRENTTIGDNVIVSAGSAVLKDIGSDVIAQGNPARAILQNKTGDIYKREKSMK